MSQLSTYLNKYLQGLEICPKNIMCRRQRKLPFDPICFPQMEICISIGNPLDLQN